MSALAPAAALLVAALLVLVPGCAVLRVLVPQLGAARTLVAAPAVSAGVLYTCGQVLTLLDIPVDMSLGWTLLALASVVLLLSARTVRAQGRSIVLTRPVALAVVAGSVVSAVLWIAVVGSLTAVPPHDDGYNHAFWVARLVELRSLDPTDVFVAGPFDPAANGFYPLALHQQAAMVTLATGVDVGLALTLASLLPVIFALPLGMALLTQRVLPEHQAVAVAVPLVVAVQPVLMYSTSWWGGLTMAVGLALLPGVLDVLLRLADGLDLRAVAASAVAIVGLAGLHTSEVVLLAVVATLLTLARSHGPHLVRDAVRRTCVLAAPFVAALVLLTPVLLQMARVYGQVSANKPGQVGSISLSEALSRVLLLQVGIPPTAPLAMAVAAWVGIGLVVARGSRDARVWAGLCGGFAALTLWLWAWPGPVVNLLTSFWFSSAPRLEYILVLLLLPFVAAGVVLPVQAFWGQLRAPEGFVPPGTRTTIVGVSSVALSLAFVATSLSATVGGGRENYREFSLVDRHERAAFHFLAEQADGDERVLNQLQDGSAWMYSLAGVQPFLATKSDRYYAPEWEPGRYLLAEAGSAHEDHRVARLLLDHRIRFVYVSDRVFPSRRAELNREELQRSPAYRQVFSSGDAHVFAVVPSGLAAPAPQTTLRPS